MFRLMSNQCLNQQKIKILFTRTRNFNNADTLCHPFNSNFSRQLLKDSSVSSCAITSKQNCRYLSTAELMKKIIKRRKKRSRNKKTTELLQVTDTATKQTTTTVQKLKAKKLSDFIDEPASTCSFLNLNKDNNKYIRAIDILENGNLDSNINDAPILFVKNNVDELKLTNDGMQEILDSYNAYKECSVLNPVIIEESLEEIDEEPILESFEIEDHILSEPLSTFPKTTKNVSASKSNSESKKFKGHKTNSKISKFKSKVHKSIEMEKLSKKKSLVFSLTAFLDCCVNNGMLNRGYVTLLNYRYKCRDSPCTFSKIDDINLYNILMHGFAEKLNFVKIKELYNILKEDKIKVNPQSFSAIFECLGRIIESPEAFAKNQFSNESDVKKCLSFWHSEAVHQNITMNDILDKSIFVRDQREIVLKTLQILEPNFEPNYTPIEILYNNKLLNNLNENVKPIGFNSLEHNEKMDGAEIMDSKKGFSRDQYFELGKEQLQNELKGFVSVKSIQKFSDPDSTVLHYRKAISDIQNQWKNTIILSFNRDMNTIRSSTNTKSHRAINLLPYLRALEVEDYAEILLKEIRMLSEGSETYSPTVGQLYKALGNKVQIRYHMEQKRSNGILQKSGEIYGLYCDILSKCNSSDSPRQCWQRLVHLTKNVGPSMDFSEISWPIAAKMGVGKFLYNILMRDLKIDVNIIRNSKNVKSENPLPAFYTLFRNQGRIVKEEVKPHPVLSKLYRGSQQENLLFDANLIPMLCPPQPWNTTKNGGYLISKSDLIRLPQQAHQQIDRINNTNLQDLYPALDSLNQLASIPWKVNTEILDVIVKVFNEGGNEKLDVPPQSLPSCDIPSANDTNLTNVEKFKMFRQKMLHRRKQAEMYSLWCDALYRLSLANHFRDKVFWLPHNMDFRGRVYPIPPHLNHLGSDLARSLLVFHQAKPLGVDGFSWLKLHCINLTGLKKNDSIRERLLYAEQIMDDILDSADHPLDGKMWWAKSEEPWQTLSCCMEIAKVYRSPDPEKFMSSFPIHQDGSCNGLQHYAALGRDQVGAVSVNLAPSKVPQDVYSGVVKLVEIARQKDADNEIQVAKVLKNFVKRKVIKQTVMTTVYGVTRYGARLQIAKQLKDLDDFPKDFVWPASTYLTSKTFDSIREMFTSTREIQDWFTDCARLISTVCGQNVEWITPLGLPVVQPYNRQEKFRNVAIKNNKMNEHFNIDMYEKPNIMKQKNAFPPNFIHSLDSSHMMLTSLNCEKQGLTFISVHDCFWTHACTVPEMNKICREQFVALHSQPILEDLSEFLMKKYSYSEKQFSNDGSVGDMSKRKLNRILTMVPEKGDFDLNNVLDSVYFFS